MSSTPVSTGRFSMPEISLPSRSASGTPRRLMPTSARSSLPLLFSTISWARRTRVRSISEADISLPLMRRPGLFSVSLIDCLSQDDTRGCRFGASCGESVTIPRADNQTDERRVRAWNRAPSAPPPTAKKISAVTSKSTAPNMHRRGLPAKAATTCTSECSAHRCPAWSIAEQPGRQ